MQENNSYDQSNLADCIALFAIYMPILRKETHAFVRLWNNHKIRKQPNRPSVISGQPIKNYFYPDTHVQNLGIVPPTELLDIMHKDVELWGKFELIVTYEIINDNRYR